MKKFLCQFFFYFCISIKCFSLPPERFWLQVKQIRNKNIFDKMKKKGLSLIILIAVVAGVCIISCPDKQKHLDAINKELKTFNSLATDSDEDAEADALSATLNSLANNFTFWGIKQSLEVDNYFLFSTGKVTDRNGKAKRLSFGICGHVFTTFDKEDIDDWINNL